MRGARSRAAADAGVLAPPRSRHDEYSSHGLSRLTGPVAVIHHRGLTNSYRAELVRAARQGPDFNPGTGEPASWDARGPATVSWLACGRLRRDEMAAGGSTHPGRDRRRTGDGHTGFVCVGPGRPPTAALRAALYGTRSLPGPQLIATRRPPRRWPAPASTGSAEMSAVLASEKPLSLLSPWGPPGSDVIPASAALRVSLPSP